MKTTENKFLPQHSKKNVLLKYLFFFFFNFNLLNSNTVYAQQWKIDSLTINLKQTIHDTDRVKTLNILAWELRSINFDTSIVLSTQALRISEKLFWQKGIGNSFHNLGSFNLLKGNYPQSLEFFKSALAIKEKLKDINGIGNTLGNIGMVYVNQADYPQALNYYFRSLKMSEEDGNKSGIARQLGKIGNVFALQANYPKALEYYFKTLKMSEDLNNTEGIIINLGNIGNVYNNQGNYSQALDYLLRSLKMAEEDGNKFGIAYALGNIAIVYNYLRNYPQALDYYLKSLKLHEELGDKRSMALNLGNLGSLYTSTGKFKEAEECLTRSIALSDSIGSLDVIKEGYQNLSILYDTAGKHKLAFEYYKKYIATRDSINNSDNQIKQVQSEMNYEFEKKETATKAEQEKKDAIAQGELEKQKLLRNSIATGAGIISLSALLSFVFYKRKRDAEQKQKETALSLQVSETEMKALRSQMNPHFIFNALQSIQTFLMSHQSEEANTYLLKFSKLMRAVLENSQHREISLQKDMQALELYMQLESIRLPHPFTYTFHIDETIDVEETTIPPLILQPFVENAIWHGLQYKTEPGHINIYLSKIDNSLHAIVEDNGVGRDMNKLVNQPMLLKKESLGMKLTEERLKILNELKKIKAQFKITDLFTKENTPSGTRVELSLPLVA